MDTERVLENRIAVQKVPSVICDRTKAITAILKASKAAFFASAKESQ